MNWPILAALLAVTFTGPDGPWLVENRSDGPILCRYGLQIDGPRIRVEQDECRAIPMTAGGISCVAAYLSRKADDGVRIDAMPREDWVVIAFYPGMHGSPCAKAVAQKRREAK